jgi:hypothetical protein
MPLGLPFTQATWQSNFDATPSDTAPGTAVTSSGTTHTKGTYVSLIDPVTFDSDMLMLMLADTATSTVNTDMLLDIAIGPTGGGSEQIIVPDLLCGWTQAGTNRQGHAAIYLPIRIPKGVRLSARNQALIVSDVVDVQAVLSGGSGLNFPMYSGCDAYGVNSSGDSSGTSHTAGNTGAESAFANIGSTTSKAYKAIMFRCHPTNTTTTNIAYHFEAGIGSTTLCEWYVLNTTTEETTIFPQYPFPTRIPSGAQLQIRGEASGTAQAMDVAFYCFY